MAEKVAPRAQTAKTSMRTKKSSRGKALELAVMAAPFALGALKKVAENPDLAKKVQEQFDRLLKHSGDSTADMLETVKVLREQVGYLLASADDERDVARANAWSKQLEQCERAVQLVSVPGATRKERRTLKKRIAGLRTEILEAFVSETQEDADAAAAEKPSD